MAKQHLPPQQGGRPSQGPGPDMANPDPAPRSGNDFADAPNDTPPATDQDKPDLDAFAARLGLVDDSPSTPASSPEPTGSSLAVKLPASVRSASSKLVSSLAAGLGSAAGSLQQLVDRTSDSSSGDAATLADLVDRARGIRTVMVTTTDERGTLSSRPLTVQQVSDDGDVAFIADRHAEWVTQSVEAVNVAFVDESRTWISVAGRLLVDDDRAALDELWDPMTEAFFPDGKEDGPLVLRVQSDRWEYWTAPNKVAQLVSIAEARLTDEPVDLGDSGTVET